MGTTPQTQTPTEVLGISQFQTFINSAFSYKNNASWVGDKRFFITFRPHSNSVVDLGVSNDDYTIRTKLTGSYDNSGGAKITNNLAELSTGEITNHFSSNNPPYFEVSNRYSFNQDYVSNQYSGVSEFNTSETPPIFTSGSYIISKLNDENPSLLVELNKIDQLPEEIGNKEFIVIPENLHPFIKDNLLYFLTRAGINVGGDTSNLIKLNKSNRNLR